MNGTLIASLAGAGAALVLVLVLAWGAIRLLKMWTDRQQGGGGADAGPPLRFLRALPLGPRERVVLMETHGERLLLGITAGRITLLARWPEP